VLGVNVGFGTGRCNTHCSWVGECGCSQVGDDHTCSSGISCAEIEAAANARTNLLKKDQQWSLYDAVDVGKVYVWRHIRVAEVPALITEGQERTAQYGTSYSDRETQEMNSEFTEQILSLQLDAANVLIDAARELNRPELAVSATAQLANAAPKKAVNQSKLLAGKANYAELQGHKLDALLMYRKALEIRRLNDLSLN